MDKITYECYYVPKTSCNITVLLVNSLPSNSRKSYFNALIKAFISRVTVALGQGVRSSTRVVEKQPLRLVTKPRYKYDYSITFYCQADVGACSPPVIKKTVMLAFQVPPYFLHRFLVKSKALRE